MKTFIIRALALLLCVGGILSCLCGCSSEKNRRRDITAEALEYFNKGVSAFNIASCVSVCRAYVIVSEDGNPESKPEGYLLYFENLYHNDGANPMRMTVTYRAMTDKPSTLMPFDMTHVSTSYLKDDWVYYEEQDGDKFKLPLAKDYSARLGLYSLGNASPGGSYGVIDGGVIRADLYFSPGQCQKSQEVFIANMNSAVFGKEASVNYSNMILTSYMDEQSGRLSSYEISFTGKYVTGDKSYTLRYTYNEQFTSYDTKTEIEFPDLSAFPKYESN